LLVASTIPISSSVSSYNRAPVDLPVRCLDLALPRYALVRRAGLGELFMQGGHLLHQGDHAGVAGDVGGVGEIDGAVRKNFWASGQKN